MGKVKPAAAGTKGGEGMALVIAALMIALIALIVTIACLVLSWNQINEANEDIGRLKGTIEDLKYELELYAREGR